MTTHRATRTTLFDWHGAAGFRTAGPRPDWQLRPVGPLPRGDATVRTTPAGLVVEPEATDPGTGTPAFRRTAGPGGDDHLKWCALAARTASTGLPGFDAPATGELTVRGELAARVFNARRHPFGDQVADAEGDPRLGAGALVTVDRETGLVFDFFVSNRRIHAVYERMRPPGARCAAFTCLVPVADRSPDRTHLLEIGLDRSRGTVRWRVDGRVVLSVGDLGAPLRDHLAIDHGGPAGRATPRQLACGLGLFTLLDAAGPDGRALTRDAHGRHAHRLWGQGVRLTVRRITVTTEEGET
ncbi:DUF6081 family protein [Streptomyces sp. UNOC14_S4]|uniref:DUF6081 family protein n=1 Tax=Streptomyces sp. UNOC14_S4 TaxID=2872340 RepID=UPI001E519F20|nr:DUF6081 family protein [Streptomyces sp. UNOC14_S4]MCC3767134.1 hypothetical protein [Streptomyces sp. UNOC14_S4]